MLLDDRASTSTVLIDAGSGTGVTVGDILDDAEVLRDGLGRGQVAFLLCDGSIASYRHFLALLEARVPVALIDPAIDRSQLSNLEETYGPVAILDPAHGGGIDSNPGYRSDLAEPEVHSELAVLLTTSGSTGSSKLVRLGAGNVRSNAAQIVASLGIGAADHAVTALPLHYSYGMSVVTSHALAGSPVVVSPFSVLQREFWAVMREFSVTILPGVPQTYAMLHRLRLPPQDLPALRALTQAGGRLAQPLVSHFSEMMVARGGQFFVMYGQTEAGPRIACLPPDRLLEKPGSAGLALAGGQLHVMDGEVVLPSGAVGEVVYSGPNVMMGYAETRVDLALGDVQGDSLRTGDLGYLDEEGFLFLTGRLKRITKLAGARISLDEVEAMAADLTPVVAVDAGDAGMALFTTIADRSILDRARRDLSHRLHVPPKLVRVEHIEALPLLGNGKVDYRTLTMWAQEGRS